MNVVKWIVPQRIVVLQGVGDQTLETLEASINQLMELIEDGTAPVHIVIDNRHVGQFPKNIKVLGKLLIKHEKAGHIMAIGGTPLSKFIGKMLANLAGANTLFFKDTMEDALEWLHKNDRTLPEAIDYVDNLGE